MAGEGGDEEMAGVPPAPAAMYGRSGSIFVDAEPDGTGSASPGAAGMWGLDAARSAPDNVRRAVVSSHRSLKSRVSHDVDACLALRCCPGSARLTTKWLLIFWVAVFFCVELALATVLFVLDVFGVGQTFADNCSSWIADQLGNWTTWDGSSCDASSSDYCPCNVACAIADGEVRGPSDEGVEHLDVASYVLTISIVAIELGCLLIITLKITKPLFKLEKSVSQIVAAAEATEAEDAMRHAAIGVDSEDVENGVSQPEETNDSAPRQVRGPSDFSYELDALGAKDRKKAEVRRRVRTGGEQLTASGQQVDEDEMVIEEELWIETETMPGDLARLHVSLNLLLRRMQALQRQRAMLRAQLIASLRSECHARRELHELKCQVAATESAARQVGNASASSEAKPEHRAVGRLLPPLRAKPKDAPISLFCATWNVGEARPPDVLPSLLHHALEARADVVAIAVQECTFKHGLTRNKKRALGGGGSGGAGVVSVQEHMADVIQTTLGHAYGLVDAANILDGSDSVRSNVVGTVLGSPDAAGIRIFVFAHACHHAFVAPMGVSSVTTGVGGIGYNKGAVAVSVKVRNTRILFVGSHLAAHQGEARQRDSDFQKISRLVRAPIWREAAWGGCHMPWEQDATSASASHSGSAGEDTGKAAIRGAANALRGAMQGILAGGASKWEGANDATVPGEVASTAANKGMDGKSVTRSVALPQPEAAVSHHHTVWMGDLNYRIELERDQVLELARKGNFDELYAADQLRASREAGTAFAGYNEAPISFAPTFKFTPGTGEYESKKMRVPSYCDRVLWRSAAGHHCSCSTYGSDPTIKTSDHKPVFAVLNASLGPRQLGGRPSTFVLKLHIFDARAVLSAGGPESLDASPGRTADSFSRYDVPSVGAEDTTRQERLSGEEASLATPPFGYRILLSCGHMRRTPAVLNVAGVGHDPSVMAPSAGGTLLLYIEEDNVEALLADPFVIVVHSSGAEASFIEATPATVTSAEAERRQALARQSTTTAADGRNAPGANHDSGEGKHQETLQRPGSTMGSGSFAIPREAIVSAGLLPDDRPSDEHRRVHAPTRDTALPVSADLYSSGVRAGRLTCRLALSLHAPQ